MSCLAVDGMDGVFVECPKMIDLQKKKKQTFLMQTVECWCGYWYLPRNFNPCASLMILSKAGCNTPDDRPFELTLTVLLLEFIIIMPFKLVFPVLKRSFPYICKWWCRCCGDWCNWCCCWCCFCTCWWYGLSCCCCELIFVIDADSELEWLLVVVEMWPLS